MIAKAAFLEALRPGFHAVLLLTGIALIAVSPVLSAFALGDENSLLIDISLSSMLAVGVFLGAFTAASSLGDEIRRRTIMVLLSKPIPRWSLILGKFLGITLALSLAQISWMATLLLAIRHRTIHSRLQVDETPVLLLAFCGLSLSLIFAAWKHRQGHSLPAHLSKSCSLLLGISAVIAISQNPSGDWISPLRIVEPSVFAAMIMVHLTVLILAAVALTASTRLPTPATLAVTLGTLMSGVIVGSIGRDYSWVRMFPDLQRLWISDGLIRGGSVSPEALGWAMLWTALVISAILSLGVALFARRDVG